MLENFKKRLEVLEDEENKYQSKLANDFASGKIFVDCGVMDRVESLTVIKSKIELLEELVEDESILVEEKIIKSGLKLNKNANGFIKQFKSQVIQFEDVTKRSIPIVQEYKANDHDTNEISHNIHKEEVREYQVGYWRLVTKLDTVKNLVTISKEEYRSLEKILGQGLSNYLKLMDINNSETEENNYMGNY